MRSAILRPRSPVHSALTWFPCLAGLLSGHTALAASDPPEDRRALCAARHLGAQQARTEGDLLRARGLLVSCAHDACPSPIRKECATWLEEVRASIPSFVVIGQTDEETVGPTDLRVTVGGRAVEDPTRPIEVNPGRHLVRVEASGYRSVEKVVIVSTTERLRRVVVRLDERPRPSPARPSREVEPSTTLSDVAIVGLGAVGVAGFVGLVWLGTAARQSEHDLDKCSPYCTDLQVTRVKRRYLWANVSLGVGVAATGTALGLIVWRSSPPAASPRAARATSIELAIGPAAIRLGGRF
jgi:hypothetical protein